MLLICDLYFDTCGVFPSKCDSYVTCIQHVLPSVCDSYVTCKLPSKFLPALPNLLSVYSIVVLDEVELHHYLQRSWSVK